MKRCLRTILNFLKTRVPNCGTKNPSNGPSKGQNFPGFFQGQNFPRRFAAGSCYSKICRRFAAGFCCSRKIFRRFAAGFCRRGAPSNWRRFSGLQRSCLSCLLFRGTRLENLRQAGNVQRKANARTMQGSHFAMFLLLTRTLVFRKLGMVRIVIGSDASALR